MRKRKLVLVPKKVFLFIIVVCSLLVLSINSAYAGIEIQENDEPLLELVKKFYSAVAAEDEEILKTIVDPWNDTVKEDTFALNDKFSSFNNIMTYSIDGPVDDSWLVYTRCDCTVEGSETEIPTLLNPLLILSTDNGDLMISSDRGKYADYINEMNSTQEVQDLINDVNRQYEEIRATQNSTETQNKEAFKFRGFEWGTPLEEIKAKEITPDMIEGFNYIYREEENAFVLLTTVANVNLYAWFYLDDDLNLRYGFYTPQTTLIKSDIEYYSDYEIIDKALIKLYGEPERFAAGVDVDDIEKMGRDEIISKIIEDNAVITHKWVAKDGSEIYSFCFFFGGHVRVEFYYVQSEEQFQEIITSTDSSITEGL